MKTASAISVTGLNKHFGATQVLKDLSFEVPTGAIYGVLGPNGAGKSTLIKALVGAITPSSGDIEILGAKALLHSEIGYMPQLPALYEDLSALDNVIFFAQAHNLSKPKKAALETLKFVGLEKRQRDAVYTFSGGMKQRVSLACALVHKPKVLFLDEPTAGVDPQLKERFWEHFRELAAGGVTILISTHLMDEALLCDQLTIMRAGSILVTASPREIMQKGRGIIRIWEGEKAEERITKGYATKLPEILRAYGLNQRVTRIDVEGESLEHIVVEMIGEQE